MSEKHDGFSWLQKKENRVLLAQIGIATVLPFVCVLAYCLLQGRGMGQVYLPCSEWNDELFYFKQVEGIVSYGFPQGYFGFNESHALKLSFAAWSPVLVFPWILWGKLFGWTLFSPILCNLLLMMGTMGIFVLLVRPSIRQQIVLTVLFCLFTPFVRYILSGMPEIICFCMLILFYGLAIWEIRKPAVWSLTVLLVMGFLMTLMRPYLILFLLLPCFLWIRKKRVTGIVGSVFVLGVSLGCYALIKHYLGAEYFADLFFTDWIKAFFEKGLFGGTRYTLGKLYYMGKGFLGHMIEGCRSGLASGAFFAGYLIMLLILLWKGIKDVCALHKKDLRIKSEELILELHLLFSFVGMFFALLLMYKLTEGSKHLLSFIAVGIFVISVMDTKRYGKAILLGVAFLYFYIIMAKDPYDYQVPFATQERVAQIQTWQRQMQDKMERNMQQTPNYDNVVIWVFSDRVGEKDENLKWQLLYALPKGTGISCCMKDYVEAHDEELKCHYLATINGGSLDTRFGDKGCRELYRDADMVLYDLKKWK